MESHNLPADEQWVALAALARPWGRRGELIGESFGGGAERFESLRAVYLFGEGAPGAGRLVEVESVREHRGRLVFKFRGIDSIEDAERVAGAEVRIPREWRAELAPGEYYHSDLVGCELIDRSTGERIGVVCACREYGGPLLLEVDRGHGEPLLVPFARAICAEIDVAGRRIRVDLPQGLKELGGE